MSIDISIITPCFNEEDSVQECAAAVQRVMQSELPEVTYEHIFSDNASTDKTMMQLRVLAAADKRVVVVSNSRNIGPFRNIYRAMGKASGRTIIPMLPADLQDPAEIIPLFYAEWLKGTLVVFGERKNREESLSLRILRGIYYRIIRRFADGNIPINSGEFMLIDRKISDAILKLGDHYPYIRGLVAQSTTSTITIPYTWKARKEGKSKSNTFSLIDQAINGLISTSRIPARLSLLGGFTFSALGIAAGLWSLLINLLSDTQASHGIPTVIVALFLFGGMQLFFLGLIGEYVLSIHAQVRPQPEVFDSEVINYKGD
jgi:polyisoprenyl-phosphate glycosyltransferase